MLGGERVEHLARHHRPLHPLPQVCPLWVSAATYISNARSDCSGTGGLVRSPRSSAQGWPSSTC